MPSFSGKDTSRFEVEDFAKQIQTLGYAFLALLGQRRTLDFSSAHLLQMAKLQGPLGPGCGNPGEGLPQKTLSACA